MPVPVSGLTELSTIVLDNTGAQESSYSGVSARHVEIHASTTSSTNGFRKIATLEQGRALNRRVEIVRR